MKTFFCDSNYFRITNNIARLDFPSKWKVAITWNKMQRNVKELEEFTTMEFEWFVVTNINLQKIDNVEKDPLNQWNVNYMSIMQSCYCVGLWTWQNMGWDDPTPKMSHLHFFVLWSTKCMNNNYRYLCKIITLSYGNGLEKNYW
jgi:hypothetical protein